MSGYEVQFVASAAKEFRALPADIKRRIGEAIDSLSQMPRPAGTRKLQVHERLYRIRIGQYRVVYEVDEQRKAIRVTRVRHRREVYQ